MPESVSIFYWFFFVFIDLVAKFDICFAALVRMENWRFDRVVVIAGIQLHISGAQQTMQYFFKPKECTIIRGRSQKIAPNIVVPSVQGAEVVVWLYFWHEMLRWATK